MFAISELILHNYLQKAINLYNNKTMVSSTSKISSQKVKANHRRLVLSQVIVNGPVARTKIAQQSGLTLATVSRISRELIDAGLVVEGQTMPSDGPGRPFISLDVNPRGAYVLSISLNRFRQIVTLADLKNQVVAQAELELADIGDAEGMVEQIGDCMTAMLKSSAIPRWQVMGVSVAVTGAVDPRQGMIISAPALGWEQVAIGPQLEAMLALPVHVESLANAINMAESRFGIARDYDHIALFNVSLGIGASLLEDRRILRGAKSAAGLIGSLGLWRDQMGERITIDQAAGGWGVLSHRSSAPAGEQLDYSTSIRDKLMHTIAAAHDGQADAQQALRQAGKNLGEAMALISHILAPQICIVAGPLAESEFYIEGLHSAADEVAGDTMGPVVVSNMDWSTAASWMAIHEFCMVQDIDVVKLIEGVAA